MDKSATAEKPGEDAGREFNSAVDAVNFGHFAEVLPHFVWSARADGVLDYCNTRFLTYLGKSLAEMRDWGWVETLHPDDRQRCLDDWAAAVAAGAEYYTEFRLRRAADGRYLWHEGRAAPLRVPDGTIIRWLGTCTEIEERKHATVKQALLVAATSRLLSSDDPQRVIDVLCQEMMEFLDCQVFFNFLVNEGAGRLRLNACSGISKEEAGAIKWLDYGVAVCGCAARDGCRIVAEEIQSTPDPRTALVKSYGIRAYACHPLIAQGRVLGTLSFGTRTRDHFSADDLELMKTVANHVAIAMERKRVETLLRDSECRYRELVENANSAIVRWNADGALTFINEYAQKFFGYTAEEAIGRPVSFLVPDRESTGADLSSLVQDIVSHPERYASNVNENICRDGRRVWMNWTNKAILGADGQVSEILGVGLDITERTKIEAALRESEERLRLALEAAYAVSFEWDIRRNQVRRIMSNEVALAVTPAEAPETSEDVVSVVHPDDRDLFRANVAAALADENGIYQSEHRIVRPDGQVVWLAERGCVKRDPAGQPVSLIGLAQDATQRKLAEEALRNSEELYRAIGESINYGVWVNDAEGRNIYASQSFLNLVGITQEQCSNFGWGEVLHPDEAERTVAAWKECARTGSMWNVEHRYRGVDGEWHPILSRGVPVRDTQGKIRFWVGINLDIAEFKRTEAALADARQAAEQASQAKSDFLANMSHDIRTPMTVFLMALEQLRQIEIDPASRQLLALADKSAKALRELVDDILDISKIEARRVKLVEEPFVLRQCLHEVIEMFSLVAEEKQLSLTDCLASEVPAVIVADQGRIKQVLINLVGNAIKFTRQGGVEVSVLRAGDSLVFTVTDTGIGIPADKHHLLFQSFSQVDNTFHRQYGGSGLGLAISKGLVELMGGAISMRNREGGGSIFEFTLPVKTVAAHNAVNCAPVEGKRNGSAQPAIILLVEDEPMVRDIIALALAHRGWLVETAGNGHEALARWQSEPFDVILMDLQMPKMNGFEATRAIRAGEAETERSVCIIGFTAHASEKTLNDCIAAGMDHVLGKPVHFDDLASAINQCRADRGWRQAPLA
jgi:PAS domain S-box-containing protein